MHLIHEGVAVGTCIIDDTVILHRLFSLPLHLLFFVLHDFLYLSRSVAAEELAEWGLTIFTQELLLGRAAIPW